MIYLPEIVFFWLGRNPVAHNHHGGYSYGYDGIGVVEKPVVVQSAEVVATPAVVDYGYVDGGLL